MKKKEIIASIAIAGTIVGTAAHHKVPNYSGPEVNSNNNNIKDVTLLAGQSSNEVGQVVNTSFLHFRSGPSTNDSIIQTLPGNQKMNILGEYGSWYKVNINGTIGYVYSAYVNIISGTSNEVGTLVNTTFLHLRSSASIYSDILETIHSNDTIVVLGEVGSWYKVKVNGQVGFVYGYYLNVSNSTTSSQVSNSTTSSNNQNSIGVGHLVNTTFLHFRDEPTVDSNIIETLYNNSDIIVLAHENNGWYKIEVNGQVGYVDGYYLAVAENTTPPTKKPTPTPVQKPINQTPKFIGTGTLTNTTFLHFRNEANLDSNIISTLNESSNINVIKKVGSWYEVEVSGQIGYVYAYYLNVNTTPSNNNNNNSSSNQSTPSGIGVGTLTNTTFLHFRSEPNTDCSILETLYSNDKIIVLSNITNGWYKIDVNGQVGYVDGYYLNVTLNNSNQGDNSSNNQNPNIVMGEVVNSPYLHVRAGAGTNFSILEDIYLGNKVQVLKKIGSWYEIKINGKIGYVYDYYLNIISGNLNGNPTTNNSNNNNNNSSSDNNKIEKGMVVNLSTLNVRSEPSTGSKILGTLNSGSYVNIISSKNGWYEVKYNGSTAYVSANYIQVISPYNESNSNNVENVTNFNGTGTVNAYLVNIRAGATTNSAIIGQETLGSPVTITGEKNSFYRIKLGKTYGFMTKKFITLNSSSNSNQGQNNNQPSNESKGDSSDSGQNNSTSSQITTNYPISLNDYINLEYNNWPLFSKQQFMDAINPQLIDNMFEFLSINKFRPVSLSGMNNLLQGKGVLSGQGQAFINACKKYNIDPVYFVNQSILETGYGQSRLAKGVTISQIAIQSQPIYNSQGQLTGYQMQQLPHPVTVYNLFGIGAEDNSSAFPNRALILGTTYAYTHGWTSISNAISGAADFVSSAYIHNNYYAQNTVYKLRFSAQISSIWHQYCTNIWYAKELADLMKQNSYLYLPGNHFTYDIPTFQS